LWSPLLILQQVFAKVHKVDQTKLYLAT